MPANATDIPREDHELSSVTSSDTFLTLAVLLRPPNNNTGYIDPSFKYTVTWTVLGLFTRYMLVNKFIRYTEAVQSTEQILIAI